MKTAGIAYMLSKVAPPARRRPFLCVFALDAAAVASAETDGKVWVQVAAGGEFKGHPEGPFTLDEAVFAELVQNFKGHPAYDGESGIVPWDFHHESEHAGPKLAVQGAPAQGWVCELEVRKAEDGTAELWALTEWLTLAKQYIREGQYKWASVAIWPNQKHPVTGEKIGWWLSSVALTNDPYIQGMTPLVAHRRELSRTPDWILSELRWMFGLPETEGLVEVTAELAKVQTFALGGVEPPAGVDVAGLVARIRGMLNLPILSEDEVVFAEANKLLAKLAEEDAAKEDPATPAPPPPPVPAPVAAEKKTTTMSKLLEIASKARLRAVSNEDEAQTVILAEIAEGSDAKATLEALLEALGVEDKEGALKSIVDLMAKAKKLEEAMPQIAQLRTDTVQAESADEEEDVDKAMVAHRLPDTAKPALLSMRRGSVELTADLDDAAWAKALDEKRKAKEAFVKAYPLPEPGREHLTRSVATRRESDGPHSSGLRSLSVGPTGVSFGAPALPPPPPGGANGDGPTLEELEACEGRNITEKAMSYVREHGGKTLSFDDAHKKASMLIRRLRAA